MTTLWTDATLSIVRAKNGLKIETFNSWSELITSAIRSWHTDRHAEDPTTLHSLQSSINHVLSGLTAIANEFHDAMACELHEEANASILD